MRVCQYPEPSPAQSNCRKKAQKAQKSHFLSAFSVPLPLCEFCALSRLNVTNAFKGFWVFPKAIAAKKRRRRKKCQFLATYQVPLPLCVFCALSRPNVTNAFRGFGVYPKAIAAKMRKRREKGRLGATLARRPKGAIQPQPSGNALGSAPHQAPKPCRGELNLPKTRSLKPVQAATLSRMAAQTHLPNTSSLAMM